MQANLTFTPAFRTLAVLPSAVLEMMAKAKTLEKQGRDISYLVQGEPDVDTPKHIQEAASEAMAQGYTHYPPSNGYPELLEAVAEKLARDNRVRYDPETELLVTNGAALGLYLAVNAVVEPGDEVILLDPTFGSYAMIVGSAGGRVVRVPLRVEGKERCLAKEDLSQAISNKTKALILCSPDNPTGHVMSEADLRMVGNLAMEHSFYILTDEVYEKFLYTDKAHHSVASLSETYRERTILINSFSKTYAMTGWRLGYNAAPKPIMAAMRKMNVVAGRAAAAFVQQAGIQALKGSQVEVEKMTSEYAQRRVLMLEHLQAISDLRYTDAEGGFYFFVDCSAWGLDSQTLANELLEKGGVVTTPGDYYGPAGKGHLRLSFASSRGAIDQGMQGFAKALDELR